MLFLAHGRIFRGRSKPRAAKYNFRVYDRNRKQQMKSLSYPSRRTSDLENVIFWNLWITKCKIWNVTSVREASRLLRIRLILHVPLFYFVNYFRRVSTVFTVSLKIIGLNNNAKKKSVFLLMTSTRYFRTLDARLLRAYFLFVTF